MKWRADRCKLNFFVRNNLEYEKAMITHVVCKSLALEDSSVWKMVNGSS